MSERLQIGALALLALVFCAAPTPGDVGGCGQPLAELDPEIFFETKDSIDCDQCEACGLETSACARACGPVLSQSDFPDGCLPLVHDGEVCLRALLYASCSDYETYMREDSAQTPTECNFCPVRR